MTDGQIPKNQIPKIHKCIAVLWPSFLTAVVATGLFFSAFDPDELFPFNETLEISPLGIYTIGFFTFWLITAVSGIGTVLGLRAHIVVRVPGPGP